MTFNPLPRAYLQWTESAVPVASFLRYQIWRRYMGEPEFTKIANITARDITFYEDFEIRSGLNSEYTITQVQDVAGEEVESEPAPPGLISLVCRSLFIHAVGSPSTYVEMRIGAQTVNVVQDVGYVQPWARTAPTAQIGNARYQTMIVPMRDVWADSAEIWRAVQELHRAQATGRVLMARQERDVNLFCSLESGTGRVDDPIAFDVSLMLTENHHVEEVL